MVAVSKVFGIQFSSTDEETLHRIFSLLRSGSGHDFSLYKSNTICRRIERRMLALHFPTMAEVLSDPRQRRRIQINTNTTDSNCKKRNKN